RPRRPGRSPGAPPRPPLTRLPPPSFEAPDSRASFRAHRVACPGACARGTLGAPTSAATGLPMTQSRARRPLSTAEAAMITLLAYLILLISLVAARLFGGHDPTVQALRPV